MRSLRALILLLLAIAVVMALAGCGKSSSTNTTTTTNTVVISPTSGSLTQQPPGHEGSVLTLTATVQDANGNVVTGQTFTFKSSNPAIVDVGTSTVGSATVLACAGTWDSETAPVHCTPGPIGSAQITATAGTITSAPITISVHARLDKVVVNAPANVPCVSQTQTEQFTAQAFNNGVDVTSSVGAFTWGTTNTSVVAIDTNGVATAATPGQASVFASISGVSSLPVTFTTCPVQKINFHVANATDTSASIAVAANDQLAVDAIDTQGVTLTTFTPQFVFTQPTVATVSTTFLLAGVAPGTTDIVASCSPPSCNIGLTSVFSNVFNATVTGTANNTTVFAASTTGTSLVPVDTGTNTAGTAITLPQTPNSLFINRAGTSAYLGSDLGLMIVTLATSAVSNLSAAPGKVLTVSPDGTKVVVNNAATGDVIVYDATATTIQSVHAPGATRADCAPDSSKCYILAGGNLVVYQPGATTKTVALAGAASDVSFLSQGSMAYIASAALPNVTARATCDNSQRDTVNTPRSPLLIKSLPDSSRVLAAETAALDVIAPVLGPALGSSICPPSVSDSLLTVNYNTGLTPTQLLVSPDSSLAFILSGQPSVLVFNVAARSFSTVNLSSGATPLAADITLDSAKLWVGANDGTLHLIDVPSRTDLRQVGLSFNANLLALQPK